MALPQPARAEVQAAQPSQSTPTKRSSAATEAGPSRRPAASSPSFNRRASLYGTDDRVIIDPGSRVWKVGFSGEAEPRKVFWTADAAHRTDSPELWDLDLANVHGARGSRTEASRLVSARIERKLRDVFHKHLLIDGKARKVIVVENTFLPTFVKEEIARSLFDNLKAPSVAFTPASLLALASSGRITGLVVDAGWLETTVTPVYCSRPLFHLARSSPLSGRSLHHRLQSLLRHYARYQPPAHGQRAPPPAIAPPASVLTDALVERVLAEACFVPATAPDAPRAAVQLGAEDQIEDIELMPILAKRYSPAQAVDWTVVIPPPSGVGPSGSLTVPGWVRERAAEVLFGDGPAEAETVAELILDTLQNLAVDLRAAFASSILITGGTLSLPGAIPRVRSDLLRALHAEPDPPSADHHARLAALRKRQSNPYASINGLADKIAIINDPSPLDGSGGSKGGAAPRWAPHLLGWIGGSLAGALKTSAPELVREDYDQAFTDLLARGEAYRTVLEEERAGAPVPAVGIELDTLRPGALISAAERKRGWAAGGVVGDWTTGRVRAGV